MIFSHNNLDSSLNPHLKIISIIRCVVLSCLVVALLYYSYVDDIGLPTAALMVSVSLFSGLTIIGWLRAAGSAAVSKAELIIHLALEIFALTLIFYFAGGSANPFVSYYLVPICIAAAVLPPLFALTTASAAIAAYSLLIFFHVPIHALMPHDAHGANLHLLGMWVNFVVSAALISYFVGRMARIIGLQQKQMRDQREQQFEDDRLISIATLAASTAHELGTPLNSIHLLSQEMTELDSTPEQKQLAMQLHKQANICKRTLSKLVDTANQNIQKAPQNLMAVEVLNDFIDRWQLLHPNIRVDIDFSKLNSDTMISTRPTLEPMFFNLLNNAAQANSEVIKIQAESNTAIKLSIRDDGHGFSDQALQNAGEPFNSDKEDGMGIGVYLAKSTVEQLGGSLEFVTGNQGTETILSLPIAN